MYDPQLSGIIAEALVRLHSTMQPALPSVVAPLWEWINGLSGTTRPDEYFKHPLAAPVLLMPWWLEEQLTGTHDPEFQSDLVYSTIAGYYFIRLIDNVVDQRATVELNLLPTLGFFHTQFHTVYQKWFAYPHPFWSHFESTWFLNADIVSREAALLEIGRDDFINTSARKIVAARIPLSAVCFKYERPDLIEPWAQLIDRIGCWHQMLNDLLGWPGDLQHGARTYFLSEAERRKQPGEGIATWVIREGFEWGMGIISQWLAESKALAVPLNNQPLLDYLSRRETMLAEQRAEIAASLRATERLLALSR